MHCLLCYHFLITWFQILCIKFWQKVARDPSVFADIHGKKFTTETPIKWRNMHFLLTFPFSELCFRVLGQMDPSSLRAKMPITNVKPKQKPPKRWWPGKLESMFKNSQRKISLFLPWALVRCVGKHLSVNFPSNSYNHCIYVYKMSCYVTINANTCSCTWVPL